jgi:hypothetical protein
MIVSPIASSVPSADVGQPAHSPSAIERAKNAFAGVQMRQSDTPEDPAVSRARQNIRSLKMKTNASPERFLEEAATSNAISDTSGQANATPEDTKPLSPQFAALAKQRRALQVKERELAAQQAALKSDAPRTDAPDYLSRLKAQPLSVLQEAGVTYEQLTEAILNSQNVNPEIQALQDKIKSLEEGFENKFKERDTQSEQQVLAEMRKEALELASQGDDFEAVRKTNAIPHVMTLIERTYRQTGEVLDVKEAMSLVEDEIVNDGLKRLGDINKIKSALAPKPVPPQQQQRQMRTLTNRDTATPPMSVKARAIAAMNGTLKR